MLRKFIQQPDNSRHLTEEEVRSSVEQLIEEGVSPEVKADFLRRLALKGETVEEIAWFARALREKAVPVPIHKAWRERHEILDVCGTGGDRLNTFNISTTVAIVCAAAGVPVAKHGNRAITSQAGSADVLEALGIRIDWPPREAAESLQERHFAFFFAPHYHPAFKHITPARKLCASRGQRTIFNFLGPLLNPAWPTAQLVGVPRPDLCQPLALVLQSLGVRRGMVVSGEAGSLNPEAQNPNPNDQSRPSEPLAYLDELSILGPNTVAEFYQPNGFMTSVLKVDEFPLQSARLTDLIGGDKNQNAAIVRNLLSGAERGPGRDAVLLNAAAALFVANRVSNLMAGWELAAQLIDNGMAERKLSELAD